MGTLSIYNPVWSLFGQKHWGLAIFRSLSEKIKCEGSLWCEVFLTASAGTITKLLLYNFLTSTVVLPHGTRFLAVVTKCPVKKVVSVKWLESFSRVRALRLWALVWRVFKTRQNVDHYTRRFSSGHLTTAIKQMAVKEEWLACYCLATQQRV